MKILHEDRDFNRRFHHGDFGRRFHHCDEEFEKRFHENLELNEEFGKDEGLNRRFFDALFRLRKDTHRKSDELRELHTGEYVALKTIYGLRRWEGDDSIGVKTSDIGRCLFMKKPATSKMLNNLEDKGYINRFSNRRDRRVTYVDLTDKGVDLLEKHHERMIEYTNQIIEKMGKEDVEELIRLLNKLSDIIEATEEH